MTANDKMLLTIVEQERRKAFNEGLNCGEQVATRMLTWLRAQPQLLNPVPQETLEQWFEKARDELIAMRKETESFKWTP